jgi:hypothetical protein
MIKDRAASGGRWIRSHPGDAMDIGVVVASGVIRAASLRPIRARPPRVRRRLRNAALLAAGVGAAAAGVVVARR